MFCLGFIWFCSGVQGPWGRFQAFFLQKLCNYLLDDRERCRISRINIYPKTNILEIQTVENEGPTFLWGNFLGREGPAEPAPAVKLAKLREIVSDNQRWKPVVVDLSGTQK